jgi:hypothetical protein
LKGWDIGFHTVSSFRPQDIDHELCHRPTLTPVRIPQLFRAKGIFKYNAEVGAAVDEKAYFDADSVEEVDLRAATLVAAEHVRQAVCPCPEPLTPKP